MIQRYQTIKTPAAALLAASLLLSAITQARAAQPAAPASASSLVIEVGAPQPCIGCTVFTSTDQGPQVVQDAGILQTYVQRFAGTEWRFTQTASSPDGQNQGQVIITKGGQPLFKQPGIYFGIKTSPPFGLPSVEAYEVYYSDKRITVYASVTRNTIPSVTTMGAASIFYTLIADDGTPTSARVEYPLTFSP